MLKENSKLKDEKIYDLDTSLKEGIYSYSKRSCPIVQQNRRIVSWSGPTHVPDISEIG